MEFEGLLLRKVDLDQEVGIDVTGACLDAVRRCFPVQGRELSGEEVREIVQKHVTDGIEQHFVFENPLRSKQFVVFARIWGAPCWIVLGEEKDKTRRAITVRMHKEKDFGEEYAEVDIHDS